MTQTMQSNPRLGLWAVLIAVAALGVPTWAQSRWDGSSLTVYANPNFSGQSASFRDDTPNMVPFNLNDKISSIQVPNGETWEVCQDIDYANQCQVLTGSVSDLRSMGWNDRISSLRRINNDSFRQGGFRDDGYRGRRSDGVFGAEGSGSGVTVYANPNFGGQSASFRDDTASMVPYNLNDKISSIQIPNGEVWEVCQDVDYGNQCQVLSGSVADLRSIGWNDRISSLRRTNNNNNRRFRDWRSGRGNEPGVQQGLVFYAQNGYRGASRLVTTASSNMGFSARQGSVQLRGGGSWEVCDGSGRCATINQDVSDVSQLGLNGRITSARFVNRNRGIGRDRDDN
jgi:hypothetical protein